METQPTFFPARNVNSLRTSGQCVPTMSDLEGLMERLEKAVIRLESVSSKLQRSPLTEDNIVNGLNGGVPPSLEAFDILLTSVVTRYLKNSRDIGEDVEKHAEMVNAAFQVQRSFLKLASLHQQPPEAEMVNAAFQVQRSFLKLASLHQQPPEVSRFTPPKLIISFSNVFLLQSQKPGPYVKEMNDAAIFYTNRVLKDYKDSDKRHVDWVKSYLNIWTELQAYIKEHHTTGVAWSKSEYQDGSNDLVISETELKQVIYIFKCSNSTLQIKGKINSIIVDNCQKLGLIFNNVVGIVEIINSRDVQIQVMGKVPLISINKTEGCHVYLSEESLNCEIVSAKSSEMNILVPLDGDYREFPVPEQFKTIWDGSKLITEPTEIAG
nr:PREDICTED: adenylyl cyclase-associated protein 2-like [Lepisosteus oculatus]